MSDRDGVLLKVKICGVTRPSDALLAVEEGASYIGTILVQGSPRKVSLDQAAEIGRVISVPLVVVLAGVTATEAATAADTAGAGVIQLHGDESVEVVRELRGLGDWEIWKAIRVRKAEDLPEAIDRFAPWVDLLLLDAWHPTALGGTGRRFPWEILEEADLPSDLRVGVAGGLTPENVSEAVTRLQPDLVDVSSGIEVSAGVKDPDQLRAFFQRVLEASARIGPGPYHEHRHLSGRKE